MKEEKIPETCCKENCERDAENFHDLELPVGDGEYEKIDETDLDGVADEKFDVVKWKGEKEKVILGFCGEHV